MVTVDLFCDMARWILLLELILWSSATTPTIRNSWKFRKVDVFHAVFTASSDGVAVNNQKVSDELTVMLQCGGNKFVVTDEESQNTQNVEVHSCPVESVTLSVDSARSPSGEFFPTTRESFPAGTQVRFSVNVIYLSCTGPDGEICRDGLAWRQHDGGEEVAIVEPAQCRTGSVVSVDGSLLCRRTKMFGSDVLVRDSSNGLTYSVDDVVTLYEATTPYFFRAVPAESELLAPISEGLTLQVTAPKGGGHKRAKRATDFPICDYTAPRSSLAPTTTTTTPTTTTTMSMTSTTSKLVELISATFSASTTTSCTGFTIYSSQGVCITDTMPPTTSPSPTTPMLTSTTTVTTTPTTTTVATTTTPATTSTKAATTSTTARATTTTILPTTTSTTTVISTTATTFVVPSTSPSTTATSTSHTTAASTVSSTTAKATTVGAASSSSSLGTTTSAAAASSSKTSTTPSSTASEAATTTSTLPHTSSTPLTSTESPTKVSSTLTNVPLSSTATPSTATPSTAMPSTAARTTSSSSPSTTPISSKGSTTEGSAITATTTPTYTPSTSPTTSQGTTTSSGQTSSSQSTTIQTITSSIVATHATGGSTTIVGTTSTKATATFGSTLGTTTTDINGSGPPSGYDFTLTDLAWNVTVKMSDGLTIIPVPTKDTDYRKISYECRRPPNDFVPAKTSDCFDPDSILVTSISWDSTLSFKPVSLAFDKYGVYELRINLTDTITLEKASHVLTINIFPDETTTVETTSVESTTASSSVATTQADGQTTGSQEAMPTAMTTTTAEDKTESQDQTSGSTESGVVLSTAWGTEESTSVSTTDVTSMETLDSSTEVTSEDGGITIETSPASSTSSSPSNFDTSSSILEVTTTTKFEPTTVHDGDSMAETTSDVTSSAQTSSSIDLTTANMAATTEVLQTSEVSGEATTSTISESTLLTTTNEIGITTGTDGGQPRSLSTSASSGSEQPMATSTSRDTTIDYLMSSTAEFQDGLTSTDSQGPSGNNGSSTTVTSTTQSGSTTSGLTTTDDFLKISQVYIATMTSPTTVQSADGSGGSTTSILPASSSGAGISSEANSSLTTTTATTITTTQLNTGAPPLKGGGPGQGSGDSSSSISPTLTPNSSITSSSTPSLGDPPTTPVTTTTTHAQLVSLATRKPTSAEEVSAVQKQKQDLTDDLARIFNASSSYPTIDNSSSILNAISTLPPNDLVDIAKSVLSNQLNVQNLTGLSNSQVLQMLKDNIAESNSQLAQELNKVIEKISQVNITSPEALNGVLSSLDVALKGSIVYTIGVTPSTDLSGDYVVVYGTLQASGYTVICPRSVMTISGNTIYVKGDIRASFTQQQGDNVAINTQPSKLGIKGQYGDCSVSVDPSAGFETTPLCSDKIYSRLSGAAQVMGAVEIYPTMYVTAWNITYDQFGGAQQNELNSSLSGWLPVTSASLTFSVASNTMILMQATKSTAALQLVLSVVYDSVTYTVTLGNGNARFIEVSNSTAILSYDNCTVDITGADSTDIAYFKSFLVVPFIIENIDTSFFNNQQLGTVSLPLKAFQSSPMSLVVGFRDVKLPAVSVIKMPTTVSIFSPRADFSSSTDLNSTFSTGTALLIDGKVMFATRPPIDVSGWKMRTDGYSIFFESPGTTVTLNNAIWSVTTLTSGDYGIQITSSSYTEGAQPHIRTFMEFSATQKMLVTGGTVIRNGTDGYVIFNGKVTTEGNVQGTQISVVPQSLLSQDSQKVIGDILDNTKQYLDQNGILLTDSQVNETAQNLLGIAGSLTTSVMTALNNPLSSDLAKNLAYEQANYNAIFNVLPADSSQIRYVEEYTPEEWASEATRLVQQAIAKKLAAQLASTLDSLEDVVAARAIASGNIPYSYSQNASGTMMSVEIGYPAELFASIHMCNEWQVKLPPTADALNVSGVDETTLVQLGLICYDNNPYAYVNNFNLLISSGALEAHLKGADQSIIPVKNTKQPITILGRGSNGFDLQSQVLAAQYKDYQILDLHTFQTTSWNNSIELEIRPTDMLNPGGAVPDAYVFLAYQRLPGPRVGDHDFRYEIKNFKSANTMFVPASELANYTGLFYLGVGVRSNDDSNSSVVDYGTVDGEDWTFQRELSFDYYISAMTKGCYYYQPETDRFDSSGIQPAFVSSDEMVFCTTNHLTTFSVGIFSPEIPSDFNYKYMQESLPKNVVVMLTGVFVMMLFMSMMLCNLIYENRDVSKGKLRFLKDNYPADKYMYIVAVETGYRMFATTDSKVCFNLSGTETDEIARNFASEEDVAWGSPFVWGSTARFLMTTAYPLGDLTYIRLWIEDAGLEHRESWYCNRVIIKDLQTQHTYIFPVNNWIGTTNGDGQTERLAQAQDKQKFFDEAMSAHLLAQTNTISAAFTGGGLRLRSRVQRYDYTCNIFSALVIMCIINLIIVQKENFNGATAVSEPFFGFSYSVKDLVLGVIFAVILTPLASVHVWFRANCRSSEEDRLLKRAVKQEPGFKRPPGSMPWILGVISQSFCMMVGLFGELYIIDVGMQQSQDPANAFFRRFLVMFILWILIFEPIKSFVVACVILVCNKFHKISTKLEETFLDVKSSESFQRSHTGHTEKAVGKTIADILKLKDTDDRRMRDEQLFETTRDVLIFFASLYVLIALTYYCRDRSGFYYQQKVRSLLNIDLSGQPNDTSFMSIKKADDFWTWTTANLAQALRVSWYDGQPAWDMRGFLNDKASRAMGIGKIRQVRIKKSPGCTIVPEFEPFFDGCEQDFSNSVEEKTPLMQPGWTPFAGNASDAREEYTYKTADELMTRSVTGLMNSYSGGGYTISLGGTVDDLIASFNNLSAEGWIDQYTRAVIVELSVYNAQVNYFAVVQLLVESPSEGFSYPSAWIESVRLIKSQGSSGSIEATHEFLYIAFAVFTFIKEVIYFIYYRHKSFKVAPRGGVFTNLYGLIFYKMTLWHVMDLIVGVLAMVSVIAYALRQSYTDDAVDMFTTNNGNAYINLSSQRDAELTFNTCLAGVVFFVACKMIRILKFNRRIGVLADTLENAGEAMLSFGVAFIFICIAFNCALYHLLWDKLDGYKSVVTTFETTLAGMLGKFVVADLFKISQLGSIIFVIFMFTATLILLNIYVMIIMYEFEQVRNDSSRQTNDYEIIEHIQSKVMRKFGLIEAKDSMAKVIPDAMKDFRNVNRLIAKVNMLHHRVMHMRQLDDSFELLRKKTFDSDYDVRRPISS